MLLDYGSELDSGDNDGRTPLHIACQQGNSDIVRLLVHKGANVEAKSHEGNTPLRVACLSMRKEIARYLIERGAAQVDTRDADGRTILMVCLIAAATSADPTSSSSSQNQSNMNVIILFFCVITVISRLLSFWEFLDLTRLYPGIYGIRLCKIGKNLWDFGKSE